MTNYQPRQRRTNPFDDESFPAVQKISPQREQNLSQPRYTFDESSDDFHFQLAPADRVQPRPSANRNEITSSFERPSHEHSTNISAYVTDDIAEGKASFGHNVARIVFEAFGTAGISAFGIGMLSWIVDRFALKFVSDNYTMAPMSLHITSAVLAFFTVMLFTFLYLGLDKATGAAKGIYTGLIWVIILSAIAYVTLTSLTVYAVVYLILIIGIAIPLSYIPNIVTSNRYATE